MMELSIFTVDAFTSIPFRGNPAAVCLLPPEVDLPDDMKQKIALEMNLSETAFVAVKDSKESFKEASEFLLRWFTPKNEVPLCGHATLATSAVLFKVCGNISKTLTFKTLSGDLHASILPNGMIALDLPLNKPVPISPSEVSDLLKVSIKSLPYEEIAYSPTTKKVLIRLADSVSRSELEALEPETAKMTAIKQNVDVVGVIITLKGSESNGCIDENGKVYDFVSRYFAPWFGIPEDPVTGAAHTVLSPYWSNILKRTKLYARQCSKRSGDLCIEVQENGRLSLAGHASLVLKGSITVPASSKTS